MAQKKNSIEIWKNLHGECWRERTEFVHRRWSMNEDYKQHNVYIDNIEERHVGNWKDKLIAWEEDT